MANIIIPSGSFGTYVGSVLTPTGPGSAMSYLQNLLSFLKVSSSDVVTFIPSGVDSSGNAVIEVVINGTVTPYALPYNTTTPSTSTTSSVSSSIVDLSNIITIDSSSIYRSYIQGTLQPIGPATIFVTNTSPTFSVQVSFDTLNGISFDPTSFVLNPLSARGVNITFDSTVINNLPPGSNKLTTVLNLYTNNITSASTSS